jgi:hypothetical protein
VSSRHADLLEALADGLERGEAPLNETFLIEHEVTSTECLDLADSLEMGARLLVWAARHPKQAVVAASGAGDALFMDAFVRLMSRV